MTLTEEQRAAIHAVSGLLTAIGCPQCHSYLQKNYTHHIEVIRAMTDSSEHFSDATKMIGFDLEKAREAIEEAVDRLSQKIGDEDGPIWEKEPEKAAVLQTLLDEIAHLEKWMIKNRDAATELQYQLDDAVKENERLRAIIDTPSEEPEWVVDFKKLNRFAGVGYSLIDIEIAKKWHTAYRKAQNSNLLRKQEIERLQADAERLQLIIDSCHEDLNCKSNTIDELDSYLDQCRIVINQKEARIKELEAEIRELEDAHKRSGAKYAKIINELRSSVYANIPGLKKQWDEILNAPANDKIGPDVNEKQSDELVAAYREMRDLARCAPGSAMHRKAIERYDALRAEGKIGPDAKPREGLYGKYRISKADGSPVDPNADYFVLRLDTDPVARRAALEYSYMTPDRNLAIGLQERIAKHNPKMTDCINLQFFGLEHPRVWQITEERKAAILHCKRMLAFLKEDDAPCYDVEKITKDESVLVAMLEEAA